MSSQGIAELRRPVLSGAERIEIKKNAETALIKLPLQILNGGQVMSGVTNEGVVHRRFSRV